MKYGHFDDARHEYVITCSDTPLPWINYLGNQAYFGLISIERKGSGNTVPLPADGTKNMRVSVSPGA